MAKSKDTSLLHTLRRPVQLLSLAGFLILFVASRRGGWPPALVNLPIRLDPLLMLANLLSSRRLLVGSAVALITIVATVLTGRVWCGWLCPLGTVLDLAGPKRQGYAGAVPDTWRRVKYLLLVLILAAAVAGNLTLLALDPLTILFRALSASIWPALDVAVTALQTILYRVPQLQAPVSALDQALRPDVLPLVPAYYRFTLLYAAVLAGVIALNWIRPRFWCRYLCPLGALLGQISRLALGETRSSLAFRRRAVNDRCTQCGACARSCPTGTIQPDRSYASDPAECVVCLQCSRVCPSDAIAFPAHRTRAVDQAYDPGRRQAILTVGAAAAGISLLRADATARRDTPFLIRPPGARENSLLGKCVRCGECSRACPTSAIQPSVLESGLEGLWTPVLVPRIGYCDYSCHACGLVCPVGAIPPLSLQAKRLQVMGKAYIDHDHCIAWADHGHCIICEEMCPLPQKAITLQSLAVVDAKGQPDTIQLPVVQRDRCIGCGLCEHRCPVNGEAAIRVRVPGDEPDELVKRLLADRMPHCMINAGVSLRGGVE